MNSSVYIAEHDSVSCNLSNCRRPGGRLYMHHRDGWTFAQFPNTALTLEGFFYKLEQAAAELGVRWHPLEIFSFVKLAGVSHIRKID